MTDAQKKSQRCRRRLRAGAYAIIFRKQSALVKCEMRGFFFFWGGGGRHSSLRARGVHVVISFFVGDVDGVLVLAKQDNLSAVAAEVQKKSAGHGTAARRCRGVSVFRLSR